MSAYKIEDTDAGESSHLLQTGGWVLDVRNADVHDADVVLAQVLGGPFFVGARVGAELRHLRGRSMWDVGACESKSRDVH